MAPQYLAHLPGNSPIARKVRRQEYGVRTETFGANGRHGGTHAELPGLVGSSADHRAVPAPGNDDGFAAQFRIVPLLDGCVECVHVDVHDFARWHIWTILDLPREFRRQHGLGNHPRKRTARSRRRIRRGFRERPGARMVGNIGSDVESDDQHRPLPARRSRNRLCVSGREECHLQRLF